MLLSDGKSTAAGAVQAAYGALQPAGGLLHPAALRAVGRRTETGGNRPGAGRRAAMPHFDEATNGFDLPLRKKIIDEIIDLQHRLGFTLIFITHDMELAVVVADEIFVMRNSNLVEHTAFSGDYSVFQNPYSRMLLEASGLTEAPSDRNNKMKERIVLQ